LNIVLPFEQHFNPYIDGEPEFWLLCWKVMFVKYSQGFVVMPVDLELWMNCLKRWSRLKIAKFPIILVGTEFGQD
jgi:hypothetical protein